MAQEAADLLEDAGDFIVSTRRRKRCSQLVVASRPVSREKSTNNADQGPKLSTGKPYSR
ncbi:hypothetical protein H4R35_003595, partial [Dimargaris xerosporica]